MFLDYPIVHIVFFELYIIHTCQSVETELHLTLTSKVFLCLFISLSTLFPSLHCTFSRRAASSLQNCYAKCSTSEIRAKNTYKVLTLLYLICQCQKKSFQYIYPKVCNIKKKSLSQSPFSIA